MPTELAALALIRPDEARKRIESAIDVAGSVDLAARMLGVSRRTLYRVAVRVGAVTVGTADTCPAHGHLSGGHLSGRSPGNEAKSV